MTVHLTITSAGKNTVRYVEGCLRSVREQTHKNWTHHYVVDESSTDGTPNLASAWVDFEGCNDHRFDVRLGSPCESADASWFKHILPIWLDLPPEEVIVWLDGDDQLMPWALKYVVDAHERGAWATWGQFVTSEGEVGFAGPVGPCPRREPWRATHLKTFRAGLVQKINLDHLRDGYARDVAVMMPVCEMAAERGVFIPRVLYVYNVENSFARTAPEAEQRAELEAVKRIRAYPRYARLERL